MCQKIKQATKKKEKPHTAPDTDQSLLVKVVLVIVLSSEYLSSALGAIQQFQLEQVALWTQILKYAYFNLSKSMLILLDQKYAYSIQ